MTVGEVAMLAEMDLPAIQSFLRDRQIDAWLAYDFRSSNPILAQLLPGQRWTTRRAILVIPAQGEAHVIIHNIDAPQFAACGLASRTYNNWQEWQQFMREAASGKTIAMEYSPMGELPAVSFVDGGTLEFIRSLGAKVVSSEDAIQFAVARWSPDALEKHHHASKLTAAVKDDAFNLIRDRLAGNQSVTERDVERHILKRFADHGLDPDHPPIVGVNQHSGDPHFEVSAMNPSRIRRGDWVLIDLWARVPGNENVFADITWMAFCGPTVPGEHRRVWEAVKAARDAAFSKVVDAWKTRTPVHGWELDEAAQATIRSHGLSHFIRHRTGHSLSPGPKIHGLGANLDNFETRDTRLILSGTGFTIEPALYTPTFGCRSEINVYVDPVRGPVLTSPIQDDVTLL
jgi:Xaa-Pro dipeptidase